MNTTNLVRTTSYFDPFLLSEAKKRAIDEGKNLYEILNLALEKLLRIRVLSKTKTVKKQFNYEEIFGPSFMSGLRKKKITRADYYE